MRLFVAIRFNDDVKNHIVSIQSCMESGGFEGNFTERDKLHLTLAFLGETEQRRVAELRRILEAVASQAKAPIDITFSGIGSFSSLYWLGVERCDGLSSLQGALMKELLNAGFEPDMKPFKPHITLCRNYVAHGFEPKSCEAAQMRVSMRTLGISLMRSDRVNGSLRYSQIYFAPLYIQTDD